MSAFDAGWLALREPFDRAARATSAPLLDWPAFLARLPGGRDPRGPLQVVDLGCGTGANLRELAPLLGGTQHWRLVDHDPALLAALPEALARWAAVQGHEATVDGPRITVRGRGFLAFAECCHADLRALDALPLDAAQLVTASALLDLVSAPWLEALVARCRAMGAAVAWALSVDDRVDWQPADAADALLARHFRAHQRRDKGFGPALGGAAVGAATAALRRAGYAVATAPSDWQVDAGRSTEDRALLQALVDGMVAAALEQAPGASDALRAWQQRRHAHLTAAAPALRLQLGHTDLLAWPA